MTVHLNNDGLLVRYGTALGEPTTVGSPEGQEKKLRYVIEVGTPNFSGADEDHLLDRSLSAPLVAGDMVTEGTLTVLVPFDSSGNSATLSLGLVPAQADSDSLTEGNGDKDGLDATIAESAIDAQGDQVSLNGALIDTRITDTLYLSATVGSEAFTAGKALVELTYIKNVPDVS